MNVRVKVSDSTLNNGQIIRNCRPHPFYALFCNAVFSRVAVCSRPEAIGDVISGTFVWQTLPDKSLKFCYTRLNRSPEIRPEAVGGGP